MPPLGALVVAFFWVAVPAVLLLAVWAGMTAFRILFPERPPPFEPPPRRRATAGGESVPVRLRDILEDQQARRSVATRGEEAGDAPPASPAAHPLFEDLWLRRN